MSDPPGRKVIEVRMTEKDLRALGMKLKRVANDERCLVVDFLLHLKQFDDDRGYELFHCRSLFEFCRRELGLLECASFLRTTAVKILRELPIAAEYLRDGRLAVSTLVDLRNVIGLGDPIALLDACSGKSRDEVKKIVARLAPMEGPKTKVRKLPVLATTQPQVAPVPERQGRAEFFEEQRSVVAAEAAEEAPALLPASSATPPSRVVSEPSSTPVAPIRPRELGITVKPVNAHEYAFKATVDEDFVGLLDQAQSLYSHTFPDGNLVEVVRRALQIAIEDKLKKKAAKTRGRRLPVVDDPDSIPADVKRAVWDRDGGCCAWTYDDGRRCGSQWMIEFDHIVARALGGASTAENVRLACRDHNQRHARETFGDAFVKEKQQRAKPDATLLQ